MAHSDFSLDDRYTRLEGRIALNGIQALVRVPIDQARRDRKAGLRIGTYVTGYQGSPLGEVDKQMRQAQAILEAHDVVFEPGINEDMAATAIYGSQFLDLFPHSRYDGVLGLWYGKAPGLDRSGDILRHAQFVGTSTHGASLLVTGDDPACKSTTLPSDSTVALYDLVYPTLYPGNPQEVLEYGLHGVAMSRYSGMWTALKIVTNVADGGAIIEVHPDQAAPVLPDFAIDGKPFRKMQDLAMMPPHNLDVERQVFYERLEAAKAYARANRLNRITVRGPQDHIGLVAAGKTYDDLRLALEMLGLRDAELRAAGLRVYKLGLLFPIEPVGLREFANGLDEIIVVEEKRGFLELQICHELYNLPARPAVYGKYLPQGAALFPMHNELQPDQIALLLAPVLAERLRRPDLRERVQRLQNIRERDYGAVAQRTPYFCSGCPHNTSTRLPDGSLTGGGIGCHAMASFMNRGITWFPHMGGEGVPWLGLHRYTDTPHMFQNLGDGTYYHSGSKALEACLAANVDITYKILFNRTVAMTGGQDVIGGQDVLTLARRLELDGVKRIVIVPEDMALYPRHAIGSCISVRPKSEYNDVMLELRRHKGVTAIIFDQQCAAEKRRQRKRGTLATPRRRVVINDAVCEGCGDCGVKSNCLSVVPVDTAYGRKTQIHQSSCNMDYSCLNGDCPAFMTIELGADARPAVRAGLATDVEEALPDPPRMARSSEPYRVLMVGIGGTGVVTVDALLVTAALMDGKHAIHLDQTGLAQKGGPVVSNLIIADVPLERPSRIAAGEADALLAFDLLAAVSADNLNRFHPDRTRAVVNTFRSSTGAVVTDVKTHMPAVEALLTRLHTVVPRERTLAVDAEALNQALFGNSQSNNIFLVGVAFQAGVFPIGAAAIEAAIRANGVAVEQNLRAFRWGRKYQLDAAAVERVIRGDAPTPDPRAEALDKLRRFAPASVEPCETLLSRPGISERLAALMYPRVSDLMLYQDNAYAGAFLDAVLQVAEAERQHTPGRTALSESVARWLFKLMAYKDEYEVARLWLQHPTRQQARAAYTGSLRMAYQLHPPLLRALGLKRKLRLGSWFTPALSLLSRMKGLRGTPLDVFGYARIRREERALIGWYRETVQGLLPHLTHENHALAVTIADGPDDIRGYEAIKERNIAETKARVAELLASFHAPTEARAAG